MRVTRESLLRIAKETAQERAYNDKDIVAAYLTGSLLNVDPMLGGTADIDIVFVHKTQPKQSHEFVKLTPDFHLDISRRMKEEFKSPRELRGDPWLGYEMYDPILLYEREKFFDFVQASLRAGFDFEQPTLMLQLCRKMLSHGRQIWMDLTEVDEALRQSEGNSQIYEGSLPCLECGCRIKRTSDPRTQAFTGIPFPRRSRPTDGIGRRSVCPRGQGGRRCAA